MSDIKTQKEKARFVGQMDETIPNDGSKHWIINEGTEKEYYVTYLPKDAYGNEDGVDLMMKWTVEDGPMVPEIKMTLEEVEKYVKENYDIIEETSK